MPQRPKIICLISASLDGRLHLDRWTRSPSGSRRDWTAAYGDVHEAAAPDGWIVGRVTIAEMAAAKPHPPASFSPPPRPSHFARREGPFAIALDRSGKLHFKGPQVDGDHALTKLWLTDYGYDAALRSFDESLRKLRTDYVDLYFLHYPAPKEFERTLEAWRALERLLSDGRVRAVAVSNFRAEDLNRLAEHTGIVPAINQIEVHPYFQQRELRAANAERGILTQAWSPIGGIYINHPKDVLDPVLLLADPVLSEIATRMGRTTAQTVLRWHFQNGVAVIPKSVFPERIASNFRIFDFELEGADMARIDGLERGLRGGGDPATFDTRYLRERARR